MSGSGPCKKFLQKRANHSPLPLSIPIAAGRDILGNVRVRRRVVILSTQTASLPDSESSFLFQILKLMEGRWTHAQRGFFQNKSRRKRASEPIARGQRARKTELVKRFSANSTDGPWRKSMKRAKIGCFCHFFDILWISFDVFGYLQPPQMSQIA